jgi:large subunit ribosomal protein L25
VPNATLALKTRETIGSTASRALRKAGMVPATLFGHGGAPVSVSADEKQLSELLRAGSGRHLISITLDSKPGSTVLVRGVERDPITRTLVHIDLQRVNSKEAIKATIAIILEGTPRGVKESGGLLDFMTHSIEISGPADSLPDSLKVDISELGLRDHITAANVALPAGFTLVTGPETVIASVEATRTSTDEPVAAAS